MCPGNPGISEEDHKLSVNELYSPEENLLFKFPFVQIYDV